jgi:hypothetical protein
MLPVASFNERNSVRASDGRLSLAARVIAAVIGIIEIALLAFPRSDAEIGRQGE